MQLVETLLFELTVWSLAFPIPERVVDYNEWAGEGSELDARVLQVKFSERWPHFFTVLPL
jgi:hypothetical protein